MNYTQGTLVNSNTQLSDGFASNLSERRGNAFEIDPIQSLSHHRQVSGGT
jgi:hypothetical protein